MAKKKVSHNTHRQDETNLKHQNGVVQTNPTEDVSNDKLESLKSLNSLLLKEAVQRRQQVDSLIQAKGSLETVLTQTNSVKDEMMSELTHLSEDALRLEIERILVFDFLALQLGQHSEGVFREMKKMEFQRGEFQSLQKEMREVLKEKSEIENAKSEKDREILVLEEKMKGLLNEIGLEKGVSEKRERERNEIDTKLGLQIKETEELSLKLIEMEGKVKGVRDEMEKLGRKYDSVVEENDERKDEIVELMRDKSLFESKATRKIKEMEGKIATIEKEKEGIEEEMGSQKCKRVELESTVSQLNETVLKLDKVEERLRMDMSELKKECIKGEEKQKEMATEIDQLVDEKNAMSKTLDGVVEEKILIEKNLDEALKQLVDQKKETEIVGNKLTKVLQALSGKESEIAELQSAASELREVVKQLESSFNEGTIKIKNMESDVGCYKDALDQVTVERDEGRRLIDEEKKKGMELLQKIEDIAKIIEEKGKLVEEMKAENAFISVEKGKLESLCSKYKNELALVESSLVEVRKEFDRFRSKVELDKESSKRVLNLLKGTAAELVSSMDDEHTVTDGEKQLNGGGSEPYIAELEMIKNAFKIKEIKGEEMKRKIEFLKNSVAEEHKKKSFWTLMSSATTILATISLAYIARGH